MPTPNPSATAPDPAIQSQLAAEVAATDAIYEADLGILADDEAAPAKAPAKPADQDHQADLPDEAAGDDQEQETPAKESSGKTISELSEKDLQTLSRNHVTKEMAKAWTPQELESFLTNAAKRDDDQATGYNALRAELAEIRQSLGKPQDAKKEQPPAEDDQDDVDLTEDMKAFSDTFGEEFNPLAEKLTKVAGTLKAVRQTNNDLVQSNRVLRNIIVEQAVAVGIGSLARDFPQLAETASRRQLAKEFMTRGATLGPMTDKDLTFPERVADSLALLAEEQFGKRSTKKAAAELQETTRQRLANQPRTGASRGRQQPVSEDDIYKEEAEKMMARTD